MGVRQCNPQLPRGTQPSIRKRLAKEERGGMSRGGHSKIRPKLEFSVGGWVTADCAVKNLLKPQVGISSFVSLVGTSGNGW